MNQDELKVVFRKGELERRAARRVQFTQELSSLMLRIKNEGIMLHELLTSDEAKASVEALRQIKQQIQDADRELHPGYWRRLLRALLNR